MNVPSPTVALFGGTFDPFHNGHLRMAVEVKETFAVSRVVLYPARRPHHKPNRLVSDPRHRLAMAEAGAAGIPGIEVSDIEIRQDGPSYSLLTVAEFRRADPRSYILFVLGADSFDEISTWYRYEEFLSSCDFVLLPRPGAEAEPAPPEGVHIEKEDPHCYSWVGKSYRLPGGRRLFCPSLPTLDISSSSIREKVRTGKCIRGLVPPEVERYISKNGLYADRAEERRP